MAPTGQKQRPPSQAKCTAAVSVGSSSSLTLRWWNTGPRTGGQGRTNVTCVTSALPRKRISLFTAAHTQVGVACIHKSPRAHLHVVGTLWFMFSTFSSRARPLLFFSFCFCVYFCLYDSFNCISFHKFSRQFSAFSLCSFADISLRKSP